MKEQDLEKITGKEVSIMVSYRPIKGYETEVYAAGKLIVLSDISRLDDTGYERPLDRKSTRLNSSHVSESRMPSSA